MLYLKCQLTRDIFTCHEFVSVRSSITTYVLSSNVSFLFRLHVSSAYIFGAQLLILQIQEFLGQRNISIYQPMKSILEAKILNFVGNQHHQCMTLMM